MSYLGPRKTLTSGHFLKDVGLDFGDEAYVKKKKKRNNVVELLSSSREVHCLQLLVKCSLVPVVTCNT